MNKKNHTPKIGDDEILERWAFAMRPQKARWNTPRYCGECAYASNLKGFYITCSADESIYKIYIFDGVSIVC